MAYLLNLTYLLLILLAAPWLAYAAVRKGKYRDGWGAKLLGRVPRRAGSGPGIWLHAVSVGEVNLLRPILAALGRDHPTWECVISTTTRAGYALARKQYAGYQVFYCPLDFSWAVRQAMRRVRPDLLVLAELELWPNLIHAARRQGAKVAVVNGRLSERSYRGYRWIRPVARRILEQIDLIAVQNEAYADRFRALGASAAAVHVTGSIKFDGAQTDRNNPQTERLHQLWPVGAGDFVFLAGSTQEPEEQMAIEAFREILRLRDNARLILVPRHPERFDDVAALLDRCGLPWRRRSQLTHLAAAPERILLVDVVGELGAWWGLATAGFVGGSMGRRGGQNMIEPAAYGVAVSFGPNTWNFRDIVQSLLADHAAVVVLDQQELTAFLRRCVECPDDARELGRRARDWVVRQQGAAARTMEHLRLLVPPARTGHGPPPPHACAQVARSRSHDL
jgi:3-deoxy-D-manno-octulosonic-acid transferase